MVGYKWAAIAFVKSFGSQSFSVPKDYRIFLFNISSGEAMKSVFMLHCDISDRPHHIDDFRKPLKDTFIMKDVAVLGAFQVSDV